MGWFEKVTSAFRREAADVKDAAGELGERLETDLEQREAELAASPEERLRAIQEEIASSETDFDELRRKAGGDEPGNDTSQP